MLPSKTSLSCLCLLASLSLLSGTSGIDDSGPSSPGAPPASAESSSTTTQSSAEADAAQKGAAKAAAAQGVSSCEYRCELHVSCFAGTAACLAKPIFIAGKFYCVFFRGCPPGRPNGSIVYVPYNPATRSFFQVSLVSSSTTASVTTAPSSTTTVVQGSSTSIASNPTTSGGIVVPAGDLAFSELPESVKKLLGEAQSSERKSQSSASVTMAGGR